MPSTATKPDSRTDPTPPADRDWFGGRRWTGITAIGFLILVLIAVLVVVVAHRQQHAGSTAVGAGPAGATTAAAAPLSSNGDLPTAPPTSAPAGTTWSIYETVAVPALPGSGPSTVRGALATGYAHTPLGALIACANEGLRYQLAPDNEFRAAAAAMLLPGVGYDAWIDARAANPYGPGGAADGEDLGQIAGFQFVSYTTGDAVIQLVARESDGSLTAATEHVIWNGGDWKFVPGPDGGSAANVQQLDNLDGFILWRGV